MYSEARSVSVKWEVLCETSVEGRAASDFSVSLWLGERRFFRGSLGGADKRGFCCAGDHNLCWEFIEPREVVYRCIIQGSCLAINQNHNSKPV